MKALVLALLLAAYLAVVVPMSGYLAERPALVKLGYVPNAEILKLVSGDQRNTLAEFLVLKVLFYYGSLLQVSVSDAQPPAEYANMYKTLETAVRLDPYNMDAYYFSQAAFTWGVGHAGDVNRMLQYGMDFRTWDWTLPYYIGFNSAFFLKDFETAAKYMQVAANLSGTPLLTKLAARYFYEAGQTEFGILYLQGMVKETKDAKIRKLYQNRLDALLAIQQIEKAVTVYHEQFGKEPANIAALRESGVLETLPIDPYGGVFFLEKGGAVRSTSRLAAPRAPREFRKDEAQ